MAAIGGEWTGATIRGRLVESGWGAEIGFPGLVIDEDGKSIAGYVFTSTNFEAHWSQLDRFEGDEYRRLKTSVVLDNGSVVDAFVYTLRNEA